MARRAAEEDLWSADQVRRAALVLGAVQTAFVGFVVANSGYFRDDFPFFNVARHGGFSESELTRSIFGSLVPGFNLGNSLLASLSPIPRWPAVLIPTLLYAIALFLFWRLGQLLFGPRPLLVVLMAIAGFSGVLAISLVWWTAGINSLPAVVGDLLALDGLVRYAVTSRRRHLVVSIVAFAVAISFYDASFSFLVVLVLFYALYVVDRSNWRNIVRGFVATWWVWLCYLVPIVLNLAWRMAHSAEYSLPAAPTVSGALRFVGAGWAQGFMPYMLGINFQSLSAGAPRLLAVLAGQAVFFGLVAVSIWRRRAAAVRAWVIFAAGFGAIEVVAAVGRAYAGTEFAINTVYWAVQPFILALAVGLAFMPNLLDQAPEPEPVPAKTKQSRRPVVPPAPDWRVIGAVLAAGVVLAVAGATSIWSAADRHQGAASQSFMAELHRSWQAAEAADPHAFVWDTQVPPFVVTPFFTPYNRVSTTAGLLMPLRLDAASGPGYVVDLSGQLVPARVTVAGRAVLGTGVCTRARATTRVVTLRLGQAVPIGNWFLRLRYTDSSGFTASVGGQNVRFAKGAGSFVIIDSPPHIATTVSFALPPGASTCVAQADIEAPVAQ